MYVGPMYVGPMYVGPMYVGPMYVGPMYVGPMHELYNLPRTQRDNLERSSKYHTLYSHHLVQSSRKQKEINLATNKHWKKWS